MPVLSWFDLIGISVGLAMDAFAVSIVAGLRLDVVTPRQAWRLAFHFGLFQAIMPILGWFAGWGLASQIATYGNGIAFVLLAAVGGKALWNALRPGEAMSRSKVDPTRGLTLVALSVATSLDALAVGLSLALMDVTSIWGPAFVIGLVAAAFTTLGIGFGARLGPRCGRWAEALGGSVLLVIAVEILAKNFMR